MIHKKYILLFTILSVFIACNTPEDVLKEFDPNGNHNDEVLPDLTTGSADFSKFVALGNSLTSGFSDGTLFFSAQQNSFPKILSEKFALIGGGDFTQPLVNDNYGGLAANGTRIADPRYVVGADDFGDPTPKPIEAVLGQSVTVSTDIVLNNPTGPFNNMGVPLAKSFHLLAPGYGNLTNLPLKLANPYFIRMTGSTPNASIIDLAMAQSPTFFSLWIGNNDVLGYALSGGESDQNAEDYNPITEKSTFDFAISSLVSTLTSGGAKGVMANIPNVTDIAHFTTIAWNTLDPTDPKQADLAPQIPVLNAQLYGPLKNIFTTLGEPDRINLLSASGPNPLLIHDENTIDRSAEIRAALTPLLGETTAGLFGVIFGKSRQTTADDLIVLSASAVIGATADAVPAPVNINGISFPLPDKWVLIPSEQNEIKTAIDSFNATIENSASQAGLAFVDANSLLTQLATTGLTSNNFTLTSGLIVGGAFSLDGVHLTSRGYALIANEFMMAIDKTYNTNFETSGNLVDIGDFPTNYSASLQ